MKKLKHLCTSQIGLFIKEIKPTGKPATTLIKLISGETFYAPSSEFIELKQKPITELEERIFEYTNYLIQKVDASGIVTPEQQKIFDLISYIENGKNKPFK